MGTDLQKAALQRKKERQEKTVRESPTTQRGYRQIHSDKIHRQMSDVPPSQPFSVYNSRDDGQSCFKIPFYNPFTTTRDSTRTHLKVGSGGERVAEL